MTTFALIQLGCAIATHETVAPDLPVEDDTGPDRLGIS